ncbi:MAG TPA: hypothetical protein VFV38_07845 [Ktedonobacteraceae bacterium]|nr:hypothetical protein [Ktedonobacteraceae bacterium]
MPPCVEIVHQIWWTGKTYPEQYAAVLAICEQWDIRRCLAIDNTGQGAGLTLMLIERGGQPMYNGPEAETRLTEISS